MTADHDGPLREGWRWRRYVDRVYWWSGSMCQGPPLGGTSTHIFLFLHRPAKFCSFGYNRGSVGSRPISERGSFDPKNLFPGIDVLSGSIWWICCSVTHCRIVARKFRSFGTPSRGDCGPKI